MRTLLRRPAQAHMKFDQLAVGAEYTPSTGISSLFMSGFTRVGTTVDFFVLRGGLYRVSVTGYLENADAGATGYVIVTSNGTGIAATRMHVAGTGGTDEGAAERAFSFLPGTRISMRAAHSNSGTARRIIGELLVTEVLL